MRIGHVKLSIKKKQIEDEIDRLNNKIQCPNCGNDRITVVSIINLNVTMKRCQNKQCFHYVNLVNLHSWRIVD